MFRSFSITILLVISAHLASAQAAPSTVASIQSLIRSQKYDEALQAAQSALKQNPKAYPVWTLEGIIYSIQGKQADAKQSYEKALSLSPDYPAALRGQVQLLYSTHDQHAIPYLERILKATPNDPTAHEMLAVLENRAGDCKAALNNFGLSGESMRQHPESLEAYGDCLAQANQLAEAIPIFQQLASTLPQQSYPKYDLAVLLVRTKQYDAALKLLNPMISAEPANADLLSLASEANEELGNTPDAVAQLRQAIVLDPTNAGYYVYFAEICLIHESFQVGIDMMNAGIERVPKDPSLYISRGLLYAQLSHLDKAEEDFNKAEQLDSSQSISAFAMDLAELQVNHDAQALGKVRAQIKVHPDSAQLYFILARLLTEDESAADNGASTEAIEAAQKAVALKPDLVEAHNILANLYSHAGKNNEAIEQSRFALHYAPNDQTATYHLMIALRHAGAAEHAEEIKSLSKKVAELQKASMQQESDRKRYKLEEATAPPSK